MMIASNLLWLLEYDSHMFVNEMGEMIEAPPVPIFDVIRDSHGVRFLLLTPLDYSEHLSDPQLADYYDPEGVPPLSAELADD